MNFENKNVFIGKDKDIINLWNEIQKIIKVKIFREDYFGQKLLCVLNDNDYLQTSIIGNFIASKNQYDVKYIDKKGKLKPVDDFCICEVSINDFLKNNGLEIIDFVKKLREKIGIPIRYNLNADESGYEIRISIYDIYEKFKVPITIEGNKNIFTESDKVIELISDCVDEYVKENNISLYGICIMDFNSEYVTTKSLDAHLKMLSLEEYFEVSAIYTGICYPEGRNIAPKVIEKEHKLRDYYITHKVNNARRIEVSDFERTSNGIKRRKVYAINYEEYCNHPHYYKCFKFDDTVQIDYSVEIINSNKLKVVSNVVGKRKSNGMKVVNDKTIYDEILKGAGYDNCEYSFVSTDYYEIIDFNMLLHYTDASKFYEVYEIPVGFKFSFGLPDTENYILYNYENPDWIDYNDISEVIGALTKK